MKAIIMAGGLGTRLRPLTCKVPKPMLPVVNRPILEHTVLLLKKHKIKDIVLLLFYLPDYIKNYFGDGAKFGMKISYVISEHDYGTAGAVKQAAPWIKNTCLVVSGDAITDLDLSRFVKFHRDKKADITMALAQVGNPSPFGMAITNQSGRVTRFLEKPSWGQIFSDTVNMGIYVMEPQVLDYIPEGHEYFFAKDLFPKLVKEGRPLYGFISDCYWKDIGNLKTYLQVHWDWFEGKINLEIKEVVQDGVWVGKDYKIGKRVQLEGPLVLGDHCKIADGVRLSNSIIGDHCQIGQDSIILNSVLWNHVRIEKNVELNQDVVGIGAQIGEGSFLSEYVFISNESTIGANCRINPNVKIWPEKEVDSGSVVNSSLVWGDKWQRELFTDSRVTGLANLEITPEFGAKLGAAFGTWLGKGDYVVLSRDVTSAARMIDRAIMCGLMSAGVNVHDLRVMPVPIVRYVLRSGKEKGGVHVRRSPFERKLLDILFFDKFGRDFSPSVTKTLERTFFREDFPRVSYDEVGDIDFPLRVSESYVQDSFNHIDVAEIESAKLKIVMDYSYGAASQVFPTILGALNCEVISLNAYPDAEKLTRTKRDFHLALKQLAKIVTSTGADVGFLIDAGAEKIFCVDETGRILESERLAVLVTKLFLETNHPQKIAVPVSIPSQVEALAKEHKAEIIYTADDGGSVIKATEDPEVNYAVEPKGGFIFTDFHFAFDGMFAVVKILELLAKTGHRLGRVDEETPKQAFVVATVPCPWEAKGQVMRRMTEFSENMPRLLVDGVKIFFDGAWVLVIPDRDKAFCHILAEAKDHKKANKLVEEFKAKVIKWLSS